MKVTFEASFEISDTVILQMAEELQVDYLQMIRVIRESLKGHQLEATEADLATLIKGSAIYQGRRNFLERKEQKKKEKLENLRLLEEQKALKAIQQEERKKARIQEKKALVYEKQEKRRKKTVELQELYQKRQLEKQLKKLEKEMAASQGD